MIERYRLQLIIYHVAEFKRRDQFLFDLRNFTQKGFLYTIKTISIYNECGLFRVGSIPVTILRAFFNQIQSLLHLVQSLDMVLVVPVQLISVVLRINIVRLLNYSILTLYEFR